MNRLVKIVVLLLGSATVVFSVGFISVYIYLQTVHLEREQLKSIQMSTKNLASIVAIAVKVEDLVTIYQQAKVFQDILPEVFLVIRGTDGQEYFVSDMSLPEESKTIQVPVSYAGSKVGEIRLSFSPVQISLNQKDWVFILGNLLFILGLFVFMFFTLSMKSKGLKTLISKLGKIGDTDTVIAPGDLKDMDPELQEISHEISKLIFSKAQAIQKVEELKSQKAIAELARQTCHDIRSPISALNVLLSDRVKIDPDKKEILQSVIKRIENIANGLLEKSKSGSHSGIIDINKLVATSVEEKSFEYRGINLELELGLGNPSLVADEDKLKRVLSNLINNAIEANGNKGKVILKTEVDKEKRVLISVADEGCGISAENLVRLNSRNFYTDKEGGNGLGIKSARDFADENDGELIIHSAQNKGTSVTLVMP